MKRSKIILMLNFSLLCLAPSCTKKVIKQQKSSAAEAIIRLETVQKADTVKAIENKFDVLALLLKEELKENRSGEINFRDHSISFTNEEDSYNVRFSKIVSEDLNKDGITDYIVERNSEGMLGGNVNTNREILYLIINSKNEIFERHAILLNAPFSYNIIEDLNYKNGILTAIATQNYRTYMSDNLQSTDLSFIYQNGNVYEKSYLSECELAKWKNKKIFTTNSQSSKTIEMHNYTEVLKEEFIGKEFKITAELSGCDNIEAEFEGAFKRAKPDKMKVDLQRLQFLDILVNNTNLKEEMIAVRNFYSTPVTTDEFIKEGNLSFKIFTTQKKSEIKFRLVLSKENNPHQTENWEITTRVK